MRAFLLAGVDAESILPTRQQGFSTEMKTSETYFDGAQMMLVRTGYSIEARYYLPKLVEPVNGSQSAEKPEGKHAAPGDVTGSDRPPPPDQAT